MTTRRKSFLRVAGRPFQRAFLYETHVLRSTSSLLELAISHAYFYLAELVVGPNTGFRRRNVFRNERRQSRRRDLQRFTTMPPRSLLRSCAGCFYEEFGRIIEFCRIVELCRIPEFCRIAEFLNFAEFLNSAEFRRIQKNSEVRQNSARWQNTAIWRNSQIQPNSEEFSHSAEFLNSSELLNSAEFGRIRWNSAIR